MDINYGRVKDFALIRPIGHGSFGTVFEANKNGQLLAVKRIPFDQDSEQIVTNEAKIMHRAKNKYTVEIHQYFVLYEQYKCYIIMELCDRSLANIIQTQMTIHHKIKLCNNIMQALRGLHSLHICHRDIKPQNILLKLDPDTQEQRVKLSDFGVSKQTLKNSMKSKVSNQHYMAPQMMNGNHYDDKVDAWSLGIVFLEIWIGQRIDQLVKGGFPAILPKFPTEDLLEHIKDPLIRNITIKMLIKDPKHRLSVSEIPKQKQSYQQVLKHEVIKIVQGPQLKPQKPKSFLKKLFSSDDKADWSCLQNQKQLTLRSCQLVQIPKDICKLTQLISLDLSMNQINYLPQSISNLINLKELMVYQNNLQKLPRSTIQLNNLTGLYIYGNKLLIVQPKMLLQLKSLQTLFMNKYQLAKQEQIAQLENACEQRKIVLKFSTST